MRPVAQFLTSLVLSLSTAAAASLHGVVLDPSGSPIPRSRVTVFTRGGLRLTTLADAGGTYSVEPLGPGEYLVEADAAGMTGRVAATVTLAESDAKTLDLTLDLAEVFDLGAYTKYAAEIVDRP
jgi:hypothetical protein